MRNNTKSVVITGCYTVSPLGYKKEEIINKIKSKITGFKDKEFYRIPEEIKTKISNIYNTGEITSDLALFVFENAFKDADLKIENISNNDFIAFSSSKGGVESLFSAIINPKKDIYKKLLNYLPSSPLSHISTFIKKNTPGINIVSACSTGLYSIISAYYAVLDGAHVAIAGTTESSFIPVITNAFHNMKALTYDECRPFDISRNGFVMGEGAGALILEEEQTALKRGANIYGRINGFSRLTDTTHITGLDTSGAPIARAIEIALNNNKNIDWINVHGTGTAQNDEAEYNALKTVFSNNLHKIPVTSFKPYIGHLLGASSTVETILSLYCMNNNFIPANPNLIEPAFPLFLPIETIKADIKRILKLSYGFGGHIGALVLEKYE